ncbi:MAG TPA: FAD:protein FMN transferase [Solirubrobacteraceae bacterium]|nr:FAD:protein FMN transferase [Solirubrobacteraceae bacterium]
MTATVAAEAAERFACFGAHCAALVIGDGPQGTPEEAVARAKLRLLGWHDRFSRFEPGSELSRLNADPRPVVGVGELMARMAEAVVDAATDTGGLVDATLVGELESAGYESDRQTSVPLERALALAPPRRPAGPSPERRWTTITVDRTARTIRRPAGVRLDSGGIVKGMLADVLGEALARHEAYAIDCAGDLRLGGLGRVPRTVRVASPFDDDILHEFELTAGGVATSGIGRRSWIGPYDSPAHHLLDPATGRPAFTGVVQATALAPTALEAEVAAKAAVLSGPAGAPRWLRHGGVVVLEDGSHRVVDPR